MRFTNGDRTKHNRSPVKKVNYNALRKTCVESGALWEDPDFRADASSLYEVGQGVPQWLQEAVEDPGQVVWKRPSDLTSDPKFHVEGMSSTDIDEGAVLNSWYISAVSSLAREKSLFNRVVPNASAHQMVASETEKPSKFGYCGLFRFFFYVFGEWRQILVDDRLPCHPQTGQLFFARSRTKDEFWPVLLEKAYAKFLGTYADMKDYKLEDAIVDLTGGCSELFTLDGVEITPSMRDSLHLRLESSFKSKSPISTQYTQALTSDADISQGRLPCGILKNRQYTVTGFSSIDISNSSAIRTLFGGRQLLRMIRLQDPWADSTYTGAFGTNSQQAPQPGTSRAPQRPRKGSTPEKGEFMYPTWKLCSMHSSSVEWTRLSQTERTKLGLKLEQAAEFWVTYDDFLKYFNEYLICHQYKNNMLNITSLWNESAFFGEWTIGQRGSAQDRAGGSAPETVLNNPQYLIDVVQDSTDILVYIMQKVPYEPLGFVIFKVEVNRQYRLHTNKEIAFTSEFLTNRDHFSRVTLTRGRYILIPSTLEGDIAKQFLLRVLSTSNVTAREVVRDKPQRGFLTCKKMPNLATVVKVKSAKDLIKQAPFGADPYCVLICEGESIRTPVCKETLNPEWNTEAIFYRKDVTSHIKVQVWSHNILMDTYMGKAVLDPEVGNEFKEMEVQLFGNRKASQTPLGTVILETMTTDDLLAV